MNDDVIKTIIICYAKVKQRRITIIFIVSESKRDLYGKKRSNRFLRALQSLKSSKKLFGTKHNNLNKA